MLSHAKARTEPGPLGAQDPGVGLYEAHIRQKRGATDHRPGQKAVSRLLERADSPGRGADQTAKRQRGRPSAVPRRLAALSDRWHLGERAARCRDSEEVGQQGMAHSRER